jgi:hypothetical protein
MMGGDESSMQPFEGPTLVSIAHYWKVNELGAGVELKAPPAEYSAGLKLAIERGWLVMHESSTYVKFTQVGTELFA